MLLETTNTKYFMVKKWLQSIGTTSEVTLMGLSLLVVRKKGALEA